MYECTMEPPPSHRNRIYSVFLLCLLTTIFTSKLATSTHDKCSLNHSYEDGDIIVGILTHVHREADGKRFCSRFCPNAFLSAMAARFIIQKLNETNFIPGITLGSVIYDVCDREEVAAGAMIKLRPNIMAATNCSTQSILGGVIGCIESTGSALVAKSLSDSYVPYIASASAVNSMSDKSVYKNSIRTVPSLQVQMKVIIGMVKHLQWSYIAVVHTDDEYGLEGKESLMKFAKQEKICLATVQMIPTLLRGDNPNRAVEVIKNLRNKLDNTKVPKMLGVVYIGSFNIAEHLIRAAHNNDKGTQLMWIVSNEIGGMIDIAKDFHAIARNIITIVPRNPPIEEFRDYIIDIASKAKEGETTGVLADPVQRKWLLEYVEYLLACKMKPDVSSSMSPCSSKQKKDMLDFYMQPDYLGGAVDAAFTLLHALKELHHVKCDKNNHKGLCVGMKTALATSDWVTRVKKTIFTYPNKFTFVPKVQNDRKYKIEFDQNGDLIAPELCVHQYKCTKYSAGMRNKCNDTKIGTYRTDREQALQFKTSEIKMHPNPGNGMAVTGDKLRSSCFTNCDKCHQKGHNLKVSTIPGDYYIVGIFPLHDQDGLVDCGKIRKQASNTLLEAFRYEVERANKRQGPYINLTIDRKYKIGGIALNNCYNKIRTFHVALEFQSGELTLTDLDGKILDPTKTILYIGSLKTTSTMYLGDILRGLGIPLISYGATGAQLLGTNYNHVIRSLPTDDVQVKAMLRLMQRMKWQEINILYKDDAYGHSAKDLFITIAKQMRICIRKLVKLSEKPSKLEIKTRLQELATASHPKGVVIWHDYYRVLEILQSVHENNLYGYFQFIGTESWANRKEAIQKYPNAAKGSIVMMMEQHSNKQFADSFTRLTPQHHGKKNPWFREVWQNRFSCCLPNELCAPFKRLCTADDRLDTSDAQEPLASYVIEAVEAAIRATDKVLHDLGCTGSPDCVKYIRSPANLTTLVSAIKSIKLSNGRKPYTARGDGNVSYNYMNIQKTDTTPSYVNIGSFNNLTDLRMTKDIKAYDHTGKETSPEGKSKCVSDCDLCSGNLPPNDQAPTKSAYKKGDIILVALLPVLKPGSKPFRATTPWKPGMEMVETFWWILDKINKDPSILKGRTLGGVVIDTMADPKKAIRDLMILMSPLRPTVFNIDHLNEKQVVAIVTGISDHIALDVGAQINELGYLHIEYGSTISSFEKRPDLRYSIRTSLSVDQEIAAIISVCKHFKWNYITIIYSDDAYGRDAFKITKAKLKDSNLCIAAEISFESTVDETYYAENILRRISKPFGKGSRVALMLTSTKQTVKFIKAIEARNMKDDLFKDKTTFTFIGGSEFVGGTASLKGIYKRPLHNAFGITPNPHLPEDLLSHFRRLNMDYQRNPWMTDNVLQIFRNRTRMITCRTNALLRQMDQGIYMVARALDGLLKDHCSSEEAICDKALNEMPRGLHYIMKTQKNSGDKLNAGSNNLKFVLWNFQLDNKHGYQLRQEKFADIDHIFNVINGSMKKGNLPRAGPVCHDGVCIGCHGEAKHHLTGRTRTAVIGGSCSAGLLIIIAILVGVFLKRRKDTESTAPSDETPQQDRDNSLTETEHRNQRTPFYNSHAPVLQNGNYMNGSLPGIPGSRDPHYDLPANDT